MHSIQKERRDWVSHHCLLETHTLERNGRGDSAPPGMHPNHDNSIARAWILLIWGSFQGSSRERFPFANLSTLLERWCLSSLTLFVDGETWDTSVEKKYQRRRIPRYRQIDIAPGGEHIGKTCREALYVHIECGWLTWINDIRLKAIWYYKRDLSRGNAHRI